MSATNGLAFDTTLSEVEAKLAQLEALNERDELHLHGEIRKLRDRLVDLRARRYGSLSPWQKVAVARHPERPGTSDYINLMLDEFIELHGDKCYGDDRALRCGFATLGDHRVMLIGHQKGKTTREKIECNFGSPHPEGYRKALDKMRLAEKVGLPIVTLINTPGAYPGIEAEERGQSHAIAVNLMEMATLSVPVICTVIAEGGSGGALGIGVGDVVLMLEHAYYSVISPEGCASILYRDAGRASEASEALRLTARDMLELKIADEIVNEPPGGAHKSHKDIAQSLKDALVRHLDRLKAMPTDALLEKRYARLRRIGEYTIAAPEPSSVED